MKIRILLAFIILLLTSCPGKEKHRTGHFQDKVLNFKEVNTKYDDYNSTAPFIYYRYLLHFSSNRKSSGNEFDIVGENMYIDWSMNNGTLEIGTDLNDDRFDYLMPLFDTVNTPCNELGPYSIGYMINISYYESKWIDLFLYASDCKGNYDIKYTYYESLSSNANKTTSIASANDIDFVNTDANEMYPSLFGNDFYYVNEWGLDINKVEKLLYCSDKTGDFNICQIDLPSDSSILSILELKELIESKEISVNSSYDDKCPFTNGKLMVFSSDRPGGFGGFDLYYSFYENGNWSEPVNFGDKINTEFDEYRPITLHYYDFDNNLMIFSSNRPGGMGGFDLYYTGIEQMIN